MFSSVAAESVRKFLAQHQRKNTLKMNLFMQFPKLFGQLFLRTRASAAVTETVNLSLCLVIY